MSSLHRSTRPTMHISMPPRLSYTFSQDSDASGPSTPSPNTPLPYANASRFLVSPNVLLTSQALPPGLAALHDANGSRLDRLAVAGVKRSRAVDDDEVEWDEKEVGTMQSALLHPFRPLSASYPPGELPPPEILDELASQILDYAYVDRAWRHSLDDTRKKLFQLALAESKLGHQADRQHGRDRQSRPGLRRVDSMDFLDDRSDDDGDVGRTMRLSTSLQNSARLGATTRGSKASSPVPEQDGTTGGSVVFTVTPASPEPASTALRRQRSFRGPTRTARPSLLQRGRSFTADDLAAEAARGDDTPRDASPSPPVVVAERRPGSIRSISPRITRSSSTSALSAPHPIRDRFMTHEPSTNDPVVLAMPLSLSPAKPKPASSSWSDSEDDDCVRTKRTVKKIRAARAKPRALLLTEDSKLGEGLRSPFDEQTGFGF